MDEKTLFIQAYAREHKTFSFRKLLEKQTSKAELVVAFLIILELMKSGEISVSQESIDDDIIITSNVAGNDGEPVPASASGDEATVSEAVEN